ncbi:MAG: hypothetical protein CL940_02110 [Deltaproteobacteria bacterium]|nr:hypothetical protein [Deltaproteobacteria bacterium]
MGRRSSAALLEPAGPMTLLILALCLALTGCRVNPEAQSGGDGYRNEAQPLVLDSWVTDDLNAGGGDTTDWKAIEITTPAQMVVEIRADESDTELLVGAFDRYGVQLGKVERRESTPIASFAFAASAVGKHFIMVRATGGPPSSYTLRVRTGDAIEGAGGLRPDF